MLTFASDSLKWICKHLNRTSTVEVSVHALLKAFTDELCEVNQDVVFAYVYSVETMDGSSYGSMILPRSYVKHVSMNRGISA